MSVSDDVKITYIAFTTELTYIFNLPYFYMKRSVFVRVHVRIYFREVFLQKVHRLSDFFFLFSFKYFTCPTSHEFASRLHLEILLNACVHLHVSLGIITWLFYELMPKIPSCLTRRQSREDSAMTVSGKCLLADILCASRYDVLFRSFQHFLGFILR